MLWVLEIRFLIKQSNNENRYCCLLIKINNKQMNPDEEFTKQDVPEIVFILFLVNSSNSSESVVDDESREEANFGDVVNY